ncbi:MAG: hypothetical protein IPH94_11310 [Saprospiraceae bacterium]|nr:hypothetical protein [Saprospiraceae bacterium]MBK7790213.1 hypothetical protein [Saprospiraceae bacterium]
MKKSTLIFLTMILTNSLFAQNLTLNGIKTIRDSSKISFSVLSPYNFSIGSNFDFINGVDLKDLYFNVSTFSPNLVQIKNVNLGLITGVRKNFARTYDLFQSELTAKGKIADNNLLYEERYLINRNSNLGLVNTTFYFNPIVTLTERPIQNTSTTFSCYIGLNLDLKKQDLFWNNAYDTLAIESYEVNQNQFNNISRTILPSSESYDQFIYSAGITLPFIIENPISAFIGNFNLGYSNIRRQDYWNWNRLNIGLSFEVIEKEFGLNLRSEIQYFTVKNPPYISFSLAKYFDLKKLIKFLPE